MTMKSWTCGASSWPLDPVGKKEPNSLRSPYSRKCVRLGLMALVKAGVVSVWTPFMSKAEQTQLVSMKHILLAGFQVLLGFGKCSQILFLVTFKS